MRQLTNKQMSMIIGGKKWLCTYIPVNPLPVPPPDSGGDGAIGPSVIVEAATASEAADKVHESTGALQVNCTSYE